MARPPKGSYSAAQFAILGEALEAHREKLECILGGLESLKRKDVPIDSTTALTKAIDTIDAVLDDVLMELRKGVPLEQRGWDYRPKKKRLPGTTR